MARTSFVKYTAILVVVLSLSGFGLCLTKSELAEFLPYGLPSHDNLRLFGKYILSYDRRFKVPLWVMEHLKPNMFLPNTSIDRDLNFREDSSLHPYFRSKNKDYRSTIYDKGHLAPAADFNLDKSSSSESFILSNIAPQVASMNRGVWLRLENYVRRRAKESNNTYVVSGPLYMPTETKDGKKYLRFEIIGESNVAVPTHFYKVLLTEGKRVRGKPEAIIEAFVIPNSPDIDRQAHIDEYRITVEELPLYEQASGLLFFNRVDRTKVKSRKSVKSN